MIFTTVGVGPGDPGLVTVKAIDVLKNSDLIIFPLSSEEKKSVAEGIVCEHLGEQSGTMPGRRILRMVFPMTKDSKARDEKLKLQLEETRSVWEGLRRVAMPVIGDAALYSTSAYLYAVWRELLPSLELEIVPGISAHSAISAHVGRFLALGDAVLTVIPGTGDADATVRALVAADTAALFKPVALGEKLADVVERSGPWSRILRVDRAGLPDERILWGGSALSAPGEYLSTLILWR